MISNGNATFLNNYLQGNGISRKALLDKGRLAIVWNSSGILLDGGLNFDPLRAAHVAVHGSHASRFVTEN